MINPLYAMMAGIPIVALAMCAYAIGVSRRDAKALRATEPENQPHLPSRAAESL